MYAARNCLCNTHLVHKEVKLKNLLHGPPHSFINSLTVLQILTDQRRPLTDTLSSNFELIGTPLTVKEQREDWQSSLWEAGWMVSGQTGCHFPCALGSRGS